MEPVTTTHVASVIEEDVHRLAGLLSGGHVEDAIEQGEKLAALACDLMIRSHQLHRVRVVAPALAEAFPTSSYFRHLAIGLATLPKRCQDPEFDAFRDDRDAEVQQVRRTGATTVLLGFSGKQGKMTLPLSLMHRWFGAHSTHVIYLRDSSGRGYVDGIGALGPDYDATIAKLRSLIDALAPARVVCQGHSIGGHAALRMGLDLRADAVLAFSASTDPLLVIARHKKVRSVLGLEPDADLAEHFGARINMRAAYAAAASRPRAHLVFSSGHESDREQAVAMRGIADVTLERVDAADDHGVFYHVLQSGRYRKLLRDLLTGTGRFQR